MMCGYLPVNHLVRAPVFAPTKEAVLFHWLPKDAEGEVAESLSVDETLSH